MLHALRFPGKKWIAGSSLSLADVSGFCLLLGYFEKSLEESDRAQIPNVMRWFEACQAEQGFEIVGEVCYCTKEKVGRGFGFYRCGVYAYV